jgi:hypothetical protein
MKQERAFWITNISDRNITLGDLNISVPARASVNLLDNRHYSFSEIQLKNSAMNGSIFKKSDKIVVRKVPPVVQLSQRPMDIAHQGLPSRTKSVYEIKTEEYEELKIDELQETLGELNDNKSS